MFILGKQQIHARVSRNEFPDNSCSKVGVAQVAVVETLRRSSNANTDIRAKVARQSTAGCIFAYAFGSLVARELVLSSKIYGRREWSAPDV